MGTVQWRMGEGGEGGGEGGRKGRGGNDRRGSRTKLRQKGGITDL